VHVCVCMCACVYVCACVCACVCTCVHVCVRGDEVVNVLLSNAHLVPVACHLSRELTNCMPLAHTLKQEMM